MLFPHLCTSRIGFNWFHGDNGSKQTWDRIQNGILGRLRSHFGVKVWLPKFHPTIHSPWQSNTAAISVWIFLLCSHFHRCLLLKKKPHQSFTCKYPHRHSVFADCRAVLFSGSNVCSNNMLRLIIQDRIVPKCKKRCRWRELQSKSSLTCPATQIKWNFKNVDFKTWYQQQ